MIINGREKLVSTYGKALEIRLAEDETVATTFNMVNCDRVHLGWIAKVGEEPYAWTVTLSFGKRDYEFEFETSREASAFELVATVAQRARA